jgi:hypothetical protein
MGEVADTTKLYQHQLVRFAPVLRTLPAAKYIGGGLAFLRGLGELAGFAAPAFNANIPPNLSSATQVEGIFTVALRELGLPYSP